MSQKIYTNIISYKYVYKKFNVKYLHIYITLWQFIKKEDHRYSLLIKSRVAMFNNAPPTILLYGPISFYSNFVAPLNIQLS